MATRKVKDEADPVNHPPHYNEHPSGVECIDIVEHMSFNLGNAVKYIWRADLKGGDEDLQKAIWYLQRELTRRERLSHGVVEPTKIGKDPDVP